MRPFSRISFSRRVIDQVLDQICLGFHFVCAAGKEVKCLGGDRRGIREISLIDFSAGVLSTSDGGVVIA